MLFPIALQAGRLRALVVGAGSSGSRKAIALAAAGSHVRVLAREISPELRAFAAANPLLTITVGSYSPESLGDEQLVIAATESPETNAGIASDARRLGKLVNRADSGDESDFHTMALHRAGDLVIAVGANGAPSAAARVRDAIAETIGTAYADAIALVRNIRASSTSDTAGKWRAAESDIIGADFCRSVEQGTFAEKAKKWL